METSAMVSEWSHKRIGFVPTSGASFLSGLLAKPVTRLAGQEALAHLAPWDLQQKSRTKLMLLQQTYF